MKSQAVAEAHQVPTRISSAVFRAKAMALQSRRALRDVRDRVRRYPQGDIGDYPFIWSQSRTPLWSNESLAERDLQLGKVQNLRCALRRLNCAVPTHATWSFWKQIGQATKRRGFTAGRLLREGCLMPAVGGGLCQLSNALYDAALQANLEIIERHAHSQIVPGSAAQNGRDATVAWNYVDLRFQSNTEFFIEAALTHDELIIRLRGREALPRKILPQKVSFISPEELHATRGVIDVTSHSCANCGQTTCFLHHPPAKSGEAKTAWVLDAAWPEFQNYLTQKYVSGDELLVPLDGARWNRPQYRWNVAESARVRTATAQTLIRSFTARRAKTGASRVQLQLQGDAAIAETLARRIPYDAPHLVVAQSLLPFLWRKGALGGRTFEVLCTRLPLHVLHARLDAAFELHPERVTLREFRAPAEIVAWEKAALAAASRLVSPHAEIAGLFPSEKVLRLSWYLPSTLPSERVASRAIGFPGPTAARKGAYELREIARELDLEVVLHGALVEGENFWDGVRTRQAKTADEFFRELGVVVQPAIVEENPRLLLRAIAAGIPVIAATACGLEAGEQVSLIPAGDTQALRSAIEHALDFASKNLC